jgi:hypothetical protein
MNYWTPETYCYQYRTTPNDAHREARHLAKYNDGHPIPTTIYDALVEAGLIDTVSGFKHLTRKGEALLEAYPER